MIGKIKATGELLNVEEYNERYFGNIYYLPMFTAADDDRCWEIDDIIIVHNIDYLPKTPETKELILNEIMWNNKEIDRLREESEKMWEFIKNID